jgi:hypothetical protein
MSASVMPGVRRAIEYVIGILCKLGGQRASVFPIAGVPGVQQPGHSSARYWSKLLCNVS